MIRIIDVFLSLLSLVVLLPLFLPVIIALRLTGEGEVFYMQDRFGRGGKKFRLIKFATMLKDSPNLGTGEVTLKDDPRVLPLGCVLRKTKINELPQIFNVIMGDMSVIGPRPQTQRCFDAFPKQSQQAIIRARPGLSGIGSIVFRDEEQLMGCHTNPDYYYDQVIMPYKGKLEEWYVKNQNLWIYFTLIVTTMWVILCPKSKLLRHLFSSKLPDPPDELQGKLYI